MSIVEKVKDIFTTLYVLYTDYTGKEEKRVEAERRTRDPILFGAFVSPDRSSMVERFYYLGDWQDEYCDLTLDRMVEEMKSKGRDDAIWEIKTPEDVKELSAQLSGLLATNPGLVSMREGNIALWGASDDDDDVSYGNYKRVKVVKPHFFKKITTFLGLGK